MQELAFERTIDGLLPLRAAANRADLRAHAEAITTRFAGLADGAGQVPSIETRRARDYIEKNMRTNLFLKVVVEHDEKESPERLGAELCRQLERNYIVREAELANYARVED